MGIWEDFVQAERASGELNDEGIENEAERRRASPVLYDCMLAIEHFDRPELIASYLAEGAFAVDAPAPRAGRPLLGQAIMKGRLRTCELLIAAGADVRLLVGEQSYLFWAVYCHAEPTFVALLLAHGLAPTDLEMEAAVSRGRTASCALLLDAGVDVHHLLRGRGYLFHVASRDADPALAALLIAHGLVPTDEEMYVAEKSAREETVEMFRAARARPR